MGLYMYRIRPGRRGRGEPHRRGRCSSLAVVAGPCVAATRRWRRWFTLSPSTARLLIPVYGFVASVLPVWLLLCPRDYLSTYLKIGTIALLVVGDLLRPPRARRCRRSRSTSHGGGPIIPGAVFPFVFITIACGAHLRLPRHHRHRHHAQDDRQREATSASSATARCSSEGSWRSWR